MGLTSPIGLGWCVCFQMFFILTSNCGDDDPIWGATFSKWVKFRGRFFNTPNPATIPHPPFTPTPPKNKNAAVVFLYENLGDMFFLSWDICDILIEDAFSGKTPMPPATQCHRNSERWPKSWLTCHLTSPPIRWSRSFWRNDFNLWPKATKKDKKMCPTWRIIPGRTALWWSDHPHVFQPWIHGHLEGGPITSQS